MEEKEARRVEREEQIRQSKVADQLKLAEINKRLEKKKHKFRERRKRKRNDNARYLLLSEKKKKKKKKKEQARQERKKIGREIQERERKKESDVLDQQAQATNAILAGILGAIGDIQKRIEDNNKTSLLKVSALNNEHQAMVVLQSIVYSRHLIFT